MDLSNSVERYYLPMVAGWWLGMLTCMHVWASFGVIGERPRRHLRLVTDHGKLVG